MDWPLLHVATNHVPIVGVPLFFLLLLVGLLRRSRDLVRASLLGAVVVAGSAVPVKLLGERAEHAVEDAGATWFDESYVHRHEERAETTTYVGVATAVFAVLGLWLTRGGRPVASPVPWLTGVLLAVSSALLLWTAYAGGEIRHDEFRRGAPPPAVDEGHEH